MCFSHCDSGDILYYHYATTQSVKVSSEASEKVRTTLMLFFPNITRYKVDRYYQFDLQGLVCSVPRGDYDLKHIVNKQFFYQTEKRA